MDVRIDPLPGRPARRLKEAQEWLEVVNKQFDAAEERRAKCEAALKHAENELYQVGIRIGAAEQVCRERHREVLDGAIP